MCLLNWRLEVHVVAVDMMGWPPLSIILTATVSCTQTRVEALFCVRCGFQIYIFFLFIIHVPNESNTLVYQNLLQL